MKIVSIQHVDKKLFKHFDCGEELLNVFLKSYALKNDINNVGKTFIYLNDDEQILYGYFTLSSAQVQFNEYPDNDEGIPRYPIPAIRIARLAIDRKYQKQGIGKFLLKECFLKILSICKMVGTYLIIVDAKKSSIGFYEHYGFKVLKKDSLSYFMKMSTLIDAFTNSVDH